MLTPRTATKWTLAATLVGCLGCLWRPKPYANDPLVRGRRATLAPAASAPHGPEPAPAITPPLPPEADLPLAPAREQ